MNKDLAGEAAVWRALQRCVVAASNCLSSTLPSTYRLLFKEPTKMVLRRMVGPSLETGAVLDAALSGELLRDCDRVSAIAVTLVCDEKRADVHSEPAPIWQKRFYDFQ